MMDEFTWPDGEYWHAPLDCGHTPTAPDCFHSTGVPLVSGRAMRDGCSMCYACADREQVETFASPETLDGYAYVSSDGARLITWTGGQLGRVIRHGHSDRAGFGGLDYWTVRTPDGRTWWGRNAGPGMAVHVRAHKRTA